MRWEGQAHHEREKWSKMGAADDMFFHASRMGSQDGYKVNNHGLVISPLRIGL